MQATGLMKTQRLYEERASEPQKTEPLYMYQWLQNFKEGRTFSSPAARWIERKLEELLP